MKLAELDRFAFNIGSTTENYHKNKTLTTEVIYINIRNLGIENVHVNLEIRKI
jgi:hypothetical protein